MTTNDPEVNARNWANRISQWEAICTEQFQLNYYGNISYESVEEMSVYERRYFYGLLVDTKEEEYKAKKEAIEKAKSKSK